MKNKLSSIEAYWGNISEPERMARGIRNAAAQIAHKRSLRANLNERVKNMGGRMTTWPDAFERLMLATRRARLQTESLRARITAILEFARNVRLFPKHFALRKYGSTSVRRLRDDVYKIPKLSSVKCSTYSSTRLATLVDEWNENGGDGGVPSSTISTATSRTGGNKNWQKKKE